MGLAIGIDPPRGLAVYDRLAKKLLELKNTDFWGIIKAIDKYATTTPDVIIVCEAPQLNQPVWNATRHRDRGITSIQTYGKLCQNVGMNKQDAKRIIEYCSLIGVKCITQRPNVRSMSKIDHEMFCRITGWNSHTNEHMRDAGLLVFGL